MTRLLEQAIGQLNALPPKQQDELASRIIARIEAEQQVEDQLLADLDVGIAQLERGEGVDGPSAMARLKARYATGT